MHFTYGETIFRGTLILQLSILYDYDIGSSVLASVMERFHFILLSWIEYFNIKRHLLLNSGNSEGEKNVM